MIQRIATDIATSLMILVVIGSAYFVTAQYVLRERVSAFDDCNEIEYLQDTLAKNQLRQGLVELQDIPNQAKMMQIKQLKKDESLLQIRVNSCR